MSAKPTYSIDAPDQQRLKLARVKIEAVLREHDLAGVVILHTPGMSEFFYDIRPSYSCCWIDEAAQELRVKSLGSHYKGDREAQMRDQAATANMMAAISDNLQSAAGMFGYAQRVVDQATRAVHKDRGFVTDPQERNKQ